MKPCRKRVSSRKRKKQYKPNTCCLLKQRVIFFNTPFLYFSLPLNSSCFLGLQAYDLQYSMTIVSMLHHCHFSQERVSYPFLHQGLVAAPQSESLGTSTVALAWPHLCPWILLTRMGFSASMKHIGHFMPCVLIPCPVPLFAFSP